MKGRPPACDAWRLLVRFSLAHRSHRPPVAAELDLSPAQLHVLQLLEAESPVPMGRVAEHLSCDASNVTGLVDRLEARGLVVRQASGTDRRVKVLQLTPAGQRVRAKVTGQLADAPAALDRLSPREQRLLVTLLERLIEE